MKLFVMILILVGVLFGILAFTGPWDKSEATCRPSAGDPSKTTCTFSAADHPTLNSLNSFLAPFASKVSARSLFASPPAAPSALRFDLSQAAEYNIAVLPDAAKKFRQLAFTATPNKSCAFVSYEPTEKGGLNQTEDSVQAGSPDHPQTFAFILLSGGGQLRIERTSTIPRGECVISLKTEK